MEPLPEGFEYRLDHKSDTFYVYPLYRNRTARERLEDLGDKMKRHSIRRNYVARDVQPKLMRARRTKVFKRTMATPPPKNPLTTPLTNEDILTQVFDNYLAQYGGLLSEADNQPLISLYVKDLHDLIGILEHQEYPSEEYRSGDFFMGCEDLRQALQNSRSKVSVSMLDNAYHASAQRLEKIMLASPTAQDCYSKPEWIQEAKTGILECIEILEGQIDIHKRFGLGL